MTDTEQRTFGYAQGTNLFDLSSLAQTLKETIESAIEDTGVDLVSDMVKDNPDWWAERVCEVLRPSLIKALKSNTKNLLRECAEKLVGEYFSVEEVRSYMREEARKRVEKIPLKDLLILLSKDVTNE